APGPVALVGGAPIGRIGRSQAPQRPHVLGITGRAAPLHQPTPWNVPGAKARALVYGTLGRESAIELVDIDAGSVLWRDTAACQAGVVGVTEDVIVCADANGVRGVGIDGAGKARWRIPAAYLAMTDDRVVVEGAGEAVIIDASSGDELSRVKLPTGVLGQDVRASCGDAGRELFVQGQDGKLARVADSKGGAAITWAVAIDDIDELDACSGAAILVRGRAGMLVSIDRTTGRVTGRIEGVRGSWRARDGSERIEVATQTGVASWSRDLVGEPVHLEAVVLGELLAERGGQRLVRATAQTAVLLDAAGVRAYLPFGAMGAALGDSAILASSWTGSAGHVVRRLGVPPRYRKRLRLSPPRAAVAVPAELRDLPAMERVETDGAITVANAATRAVLAAEVDPDDPARLYVLASESMEGASVIAIDLVNRAVHWQRANACGGGAPIGLQPARGHVICATSSSVHGLARDGATRWTFPATNVDRIAAAGDVVLVFDADTLTVLDIETGAPRWRSASDDGGAVRADAIAIGAATYVVTAERGLVVARMTSGLPLWSIGVDGTVANV
ncbi:MAG TPA: PQQ-binding-like beta-propeller repeat protein, partial [Kofleriaceae bacterium]|nr:PQQ-binding-like beta-propeller repeat protein [Kofleriaceae bacterium]